MNMGSDGGKKMAVMDNRLRRFGWDVKGNGIKLMALAVASLFVCVNAAVLFPGPSLSSPHSVRTSALSDTIWTAESDQLGANMGYSVASAGDVNNDGYDDVIVGAYNYDNGQTDEGRAFVYFGSSTGLQTTPSWTAESDQAYARFGYSVSSAGDVNNDGYGDVLVGAYVYDNGETDEGRVYLYLGSASGPSASPSWTAEGNQNSCYFGSTVASAGDVNGDGFDDVLVAALFYSNGESMEGRVHMYLGSASGLPASPSWTAEGNQVFANFGRSTACAGDVNNDGYDDVVIGAYYYDNGEVNEGSAFLYFGSSSGLSTSPSWIGESNQKDAWFGYSVSSAGDVNNDGYDEVVVGAVGYDNPDLNEGRAYLYLGSASGLSSSPAWTVESDQASAYMGVVSSAGDINGDGFSDVVVGAYFYDNDTVDEGRVFLYLGSASGPSATPSWTAESDQYSTMFGSSLSSAGDVDSDGASDVIVGAYSFDNGQTDEGRAYVFYGVATTPPPLEFNLTLVSGWNFVTVPLVGYGYMASTLGLRTNDIVSGFNPATQTYDKNYVVGVSLPFKDFNIEPSTGYWVLATATETLNLQGSIPMGTQSRTITVPATGSWAIVGLNTLRTDMRASDVVANYTGGSITQVVMYTPGVGYKTFNPLLPFTDFVLVPGQAYWIFVTASGVLNYVP